MTDILTLIHYLVHLSFFFVVLIMVFFSTCNHLSFLFLPYDFFYCYPDLLLSLFYFFLSILHHLSLSPSLFPSCRLVMSLSICQTVTRPCDNESSNQTSGWQLPPQCSALPNKVTTVHLCVHMCAIVSFFRVYVSLYSMWERKSEFFYCFRVSVFVLM